MAGVDEVAVVDEAGEEVMDLVVSYYFLVTVIHTLLNIFILI